jgi:Rubrerythrin
MEKVAVRNLRLCTKDCLCLYVCPVGATDTEDSIIDVSKCTGCGICAEACPSKAISMMPVELPPQQKKQEDVVAVLNALSQSKMKAATAAGQIAATTESETLRRLMKAIERSSRLIAEDLIREAGYMLPQSANAHRFLEELINNPPTDDFPVDAAKELLDLIPNNEDNHEKERKTMAKWKCTVCGYIHEGDTPPEKCPVCKQPAEKFVKIEEAPANKYAGTQTEKNLEAAFAGESQARNKYTYFASKAKKEGFEQIAALFLKTADKIGRASCRERV